MHKKLIDTALLQQLRMLSAVVSEKSVAAAAKNLHVTQPAVSNALARLRKKTGDPLVVKVGNQAVPTLRALQIAQVVLPAMAAMLEVVETAVRFKPAEASGEIRIGMPDYLELLLGPALACVIQDLAPGLRMIMRPCNAETVSGQLDSNDIDLGLTMVKQLPAWQQGIPLFEERFVCLIPDSIAPRSRKLSLDAFLQYSHAMVSFQGHATGQIDAALNAIKQKRNLVATATTFSALGELLYRAKLVACVPHPIAPRLASLFKLSVFPLPIKVKPIQIQLCISQARKSEGMLSWVQEELIHCANTTQELR
jgi:DNA-binding transcriptional LysR family regulator